MAKTRLATLLPSKSVASAGTETIDLDLNDPFSQISIQHKTTTAGTAQAAHPAADITKIEIVDGSEVLASMSGYQARALEYYNTGKMPYGYFTDVSAIMTLMTYNLNFGRWLWDTQLALDPTRYKNPQLKITHNPLISDTSASAASLEVYAQVFDEKRISPVGYLRPVEVYSYTNSAENGIDTVELPRDMTIRQILMRAALSDYYPYQVTKTIKIEENGGARVPFEMSISSYLKLINGEVPMGREQSSIAVNETARDVYPAFTFGCGFSLYPSTVTNILSREVTHTTIPFKIDITASDTCIGEFYGYQPYYCYPIRFGVQNDPDDWYNPSSLSALKMKITAGSAGTSGTTSVLLEQLKKY